VITSYGEAQTMLRRFTILFVLVAIALSSVLLFSGQADGSVAVIYYWKAKPGKSEEYNQYIRNVAELVDADARRQGAFISVTTFVSRKSDSPWTHMRIFLLKDHAQEANLAQALHEADVRMEPDEGKRRAKEDQAASLRDFVAREEVDILK
jgi:hypothetical protein